MLIDTHAHLDMSPLADDIPAVLKRAEEAGVRQVITIGTDADSSEAAVAIAARHAQVYAACGVHPHDASLFKQSKSRIKQLLTEKKVCAVGEIGLDFHYNHSPEDIQISAFKAQLDMASELDMPVVIHCREAAEELVGVLEGYTGLRGVVHCFSESLDLARWLLEHQFLMSYTGTITFKNAASFLDVVRQVPIESVMLETDSPFLAPVPMRGKKNEPAFVTHVAAKLAETIGLSYDDIARITTFNARQLFNLDGVDTETEKIVYPIRNSLYLNITNRCTSACTFCVRYYTDTVKGHKLRLSKEPDASELLNELDKEMNKGKEYGEVVFCGYGEPLLRLNTIKSVAGTIKKKYPKVKVRIDTNGHGNIINGRDITPELAAYIDSVSISLNTDNKEQYLDICRPRFGPESYQAVLDFIAAAKKHIDVTVTVIDLPDVDLEKCKAIAERLNVNFKIRRYNIVG